MTAGGALRCYFEVYAREVRRAIVSAAQFSTFFEEVLEKQHCTLP
jgi:hypothetical protein